MTTYTTTAAGLPVLSDRCGLTGIHSTGVRPGFTDYDVWGRGLCAATAGYCLDAPSSIARGSTTGATYSHCIGGTGPRSLAFVTQQTTASTVYGDRT